MFLTKLFFLLLLTFSTKALDKDSAESNDISKASSHSSLKLDSTLRKALLKALAELENGGSDKDNEDDSVHRAQASSFTIYAKSSLGDQNQPEKHENEEENTGLTTETISDEESTETFKSTTEEKEIETTSDPKKPSFVVFQRSNSILEPISIKSVEKDSQIDPLKDAELFLTSASNNFNRDVSFKSENNNSALNKEAIDSKSSRNLKLSNQNAIIDEDKKPKSQRNQESTLGTSTTTAAPASTTQESEAKVEQVQFFSAPLVAAFTVHQDEQGQPKKVEPIFKNQVNKAQETTLESQSKDVQSNAQSDFIQKQKQLEDQLIRLKQQQAQQELYFQQQLLQQQQSRSTQPFATLINKAKNPSGKLEPVFNEPDKSVLSQALSSQNTIPLLNRFNSNEIKNNLNAAQGSTVSVQSSISFDPSLSELGKLPLNARFLPIKEAKNFHSPFVNSINFQPLPSAQQNSLFQPNKLVAQNNFNNKPNFQSNNQNNFDNKQNFQQIQSNNFDNAGFKPLNQVSPVTSNFNQGTQAFTPVNQVPPVTSNFNQGTFIVPNRSNNGFPFQQTNFNNFKQQNLLSTNNDFTPNRFNIGQLPLQNGQGRFNRQELGTGNILNNNNNFLIQQSTQPFTPTHEISFVRSSNNPLLENNRFFRSNAENNFITPQKSQNTRFFNPQQNFNTQNNNRFFRSNQENTISNFNQVNGLAPPQVNRQLNNLLFNQGFGGRNSEDLNVVTKVLSLNYDNNNRVLRNVPPFK